jgi:RNA polymerase sigma-70 factor (ECF subfamily)
MREVEGMSVAETGTALAITPANVKVRLNRAKEMLRESISGFYHDVEVFQFDLVRCDRIVHNVLHRLDAPP